MVALILLGRCGAAERLIAWIIIRRRSSLQAARRIRWRSIDRSKLDSSHPLRAKAEASSFSSPLSDSNE